MSLVENVAEHFSAHEKSISKRLQDGPQNCYNLDQVKISSSLTFEEK
jgi:hypothetical protein